jgi:DNA-binding beta-propeller fold protein YncE
VFGTVAYDGSGQQLWVKRLHSGREPNAIALDPENHRIYVTGKGFHGGSHGVTTLAYGPNGRRFWEARFRRGVAGVDVAADPISHNVYVAALGLTRHGVLAFTTIGYDPAGTEMWRSYYAGPERFYSPPAAIAVDGPAQHVYVTGGTSTSLGQLDFATVAYQTVSAAA